MAGHLARHRQPVFAELLQDLPIGAVRRFEVGEAKGLPVKLEPVSQHMERAFGVQLTFWR
jgi:hypothetical protein